MSDGVSTISRVITNKITQMALRKAVKRFGVYNVVRCLKIYNHLLEQEESVSNTQPLNDGWNNLERRYDANAARIYEVLTGVPPESNMLLVRLVEEFNSKCK